MKKNILTPVFVVDEDGLNMLNFQASRRKAMSYAIIQNGGKQYRAEPGQLVDLEKIEGNPGDTIEIPTVAMIHLDNQEAVVGAPLVQNAKVTAEIVLQDRSRKIIVFKKKRRKNYRRTHGHRQSFTRVRIKEITV